MSGVRVVTRGLVHIYHADGHDVAALSGIDLVVAAGERLALLGPSGAGKSTLLTLFGGLLRPSAGRILVGDRELSKLAESELDEVRGTEIAMVLQGAARNLLPVPVGARQRRLRPGSGAAPWPNRADRRRGARARRLPRCVGRRAARPASPRARSSCSPSPSPCRAAPGLLLGDEPTSQLDHGARDVVLDALAQVNRRWGTTVIVVTHDPDVAAAMPRTITIRDGRVGAEGREGEEFAVVSADGSVPLPPHALAAIPPGSLVRLHEEDGRWVLVVEEGGPP